MQLRIEDPSGECRRIPLKVSKGSRWTLGRTADCEVSLRDPLLPRQAAILESHTGGSFWIRAIDPEGTQCFRMADLPVREAELVPGVPCQLGESRLVLEPSDSSGAGKLPPFPSGAQAWRTASESGRQLLWMTKKAAATPLSVYLAGETGTGKEVLAHLVHAWSDRASGPFVPLNCAALPLSLAESELFGHVKGAFTGAIHQRPGALLQAHSGTLFLDEVGDLPLELQVKLLRFLENGEIRAVGSDRPSRADVRLVCATHKPLLQLVEEGRFRRDLYYRIASVTIEIPTLRSRPEDIQLLAAQYAADLERSISPRAMLRLKAHAWPGNVRELRHAVERACGLSGPFVSVLTEEAFAFLVQPDGVRARPDLELGSAVLSLHEMERVMLLKSLRIARGNRRDAAKILGVARSTLFEMLKRHRIQGPKSFPEAQFH